MKASYRLAIVVLALPLLAAGCSKVEVDDDDADAAAAEQADGDGVDRTDAVATATAILEAYKAADFARLAEFCAGDNLEMMQEFAEQGEDHPRYDSMTEGWRWDAVQAFSGDAGPVRYWHRGEQVEAQVKFGEIAADEIAVVVLHWTDGQWVFEDVNSPSPAMFEEGSATKPDAA
jgi:hypothetical protein